MADLGANYLKRYILKIAVFGDKQPPAASSGETGWLKLLRCCESWVHVAVFTAPWRAPPRASPRIWKTKVGNTKMTPDPVPTMHIAPRVHNPWLSGISSKKKYGRISQSLLLSRKVELCSTFAIYRLRRFATACDGLRPVPRQVTSQKAANSASINRPLF